MRAIIRITLTAARKGGCNRSGKSAAGGMAGKGPGTVAKAKRRFRRIVVCAGLLLLPAWLPAIVWGADEADLWRAIGSGGHVALMRHALAPGFGDPDHFRVDDCTTQRNLSAEGRQQARDIGQRFRDKRADNVLVFSSQWCRCLDTARLLGLGEVNPFPGLNSFFQDRDREVVRTAATWELIGARAGGPSLVLVTHQVNITALTGVVPQSGEIVVLRPDGDQWVVLGRIR